MPRNDSSVPGSPSGFTLIEMMVTVLILSLLATIAIPSYQSQVRKSRRTEAKTALLDLAGREERYLAANNHYSLVAADLGYAGSGWPVSVGSGYYQVNAPTGNTVGSTTVLPAFTITATAIGTQLRDTTCKTFQVDQTGTQTSTDASGADSTATCWK